MSCFWCGKVCNYLTVTLWKSHSTSATLCAFFSCRHNERKIACIYVHTHAGMAARGYVRCSTYGIYAALLYVVKCFVHTPLFKLVCSYEHCLAYLPYDTIEDIIWTWLYYSAVFTLMVRKYEWVQGEGVFQAWQKCVSRPKPHQAS